MIDKMNLYVKNQMKKAIILVLPLILFVFQGCIKTSSTKMEKSNEIYFADPTIFYENGKFYLTGTRNIEPLGFTLLESDDLVSWTLSSATPDGMIVKKGESIYGDQGFWAPQIMKENDIYYLTYTANEQIAIASSKSIDKLFTQEKTGVIDSSEKNIDSFIFKDEDGKYYLYHVRLNDGNYIWVAEFDFEKGEIKPETLTKCFGLSQSWEATPAYESVPIMEGPTVIKKDGIYYLFYSANHFESIDYAVGYATAKSPFGPWEKYPGNPIIHRTIVKENGSGHGDLFFDKNNNPYYVYHVHNSDSSVVPRKTRIIPLVFERNSTTGFCDVSVKADKIIIPTIDL